MKCSKKRLPKVFFLFSIYLRTQAIRNLSVSFHVYVNTFTFKINKKNNTTVLSYVFDDDDVRYTDECVRNKVNKQSLNCFFAFISDTVSSRFRYIRNHSFASAKKQTS